MTNDYTPIEQSRSEPHKLQTVRPPLRSAEGNTVSFYHRHLRSTVKGRKWASWEKLEIIPPGAGDIIVFYGFKIFGFKVLFWRRKFNE